MKTNDWDDFYASLAELPTVHHTMVAIHDALTRFPDQAAFLKGLRFFLAEGKIPSSFNAWEDLPVLKSFARRLVERKLLAEAVLNQFN